MPLLLLDLSPTIPTFKPCNNPLICHKASI
jgi:hypothetical protein